MDSLGGSIGGAPSLLQALAAQAPMMAIGQALGGQGPTAGGLLGLAMQMDAQRVKDAYTMRKDEREQARLDLAQQTEDRKIRLEALKAQNEQFAQNAKMYEVNAKLYDTATDPAVRRNFITGMSNQLEAMGQPAIPESMQQSMALRRPDDKVKKDIIIDVLAAQQAAAASGSPIDPQTFAAIAQRYGTSPEDVQWMAGLTKSPIAVKAVIGTTPEELSDAASKRLDEQAKRRDEETVRLAAKLGFDPKKDDIYGAIALYRRATGGQDLLALDPTQPRDLTIVAGVKREMQGLQDQLAEAKLQREERYKQQMADYNNRLAEGRQAQRDAAVEGRQIAREGRAPLSTTSWFDLETGQLRTPTKQEYAENPSRYRHPTASEEQTYTYLTTAQPMVNRMKELVNEALKETAPANLINALAGKTNQFTRSSPTWTQLDQLIKESNIELTRALGGSGQFRVTLLDYLKSANVTSRDTKEVARTVLDTLDTSIENRRRSIMYGGDQSRMQQYKKPMSRKDYDAARARGYTDEEIAAKGYVVPGPLSK